MHTGEPELGDEGYVGMDVVIAARVCAVRARRADRRDAGGSGHGRRRAAPGAVVSAARAPSTEGRPGCSSALPARRARSARRLPASEDALGDEPARAPSPARRASRGARAGRASPCEPALASSRSPGPGGAGKSRLALEVAARAARRATRAPRRACADRGCRSRPERDRPRNRRARVGRRSDARGDCGQPQRYRRAAVPRQPRAPRARCRSRRRAPRSRAGPSGSRDEPHATTPLDRARAAPRATLDRGRHDALRRAGGGPRRHARRRTRSRRSTRSAAGSTACRWRSSSSPPDSPCFRQPRSCARSERGLRCEMEGPVDLPERQRTLRAAIDWSYQRLTDSQRDAPWRAGGVRRRGCTRRRPRTRSRRRRRSCRTWRRSSAGVSFAASRRRRGPALDARDRPRARARPASRRRRTRRAAASVTQSASSSSPVRPRPELAGPAQTPMAGSSRARARQPSRRARLAARIRKSRGRTPRDRGTQPVLAQPRPHGRGSALARPRTRARRRSRPGSPRRRALGGRTPGGGSERLGRRPRDCSTEALPLFRQDARGREVAFTLSELAFLAVRLNDLDRASRPLRRVTRRRARARRCARDLSCVADTRRRSARTQERSR